MIAAERQAAPGPDASVEDWLAWQEKLHARPIELGLDRVRCVAARLDLLDERPVTLTIGGTNGKGSSATLAASILRRSGHRVGLYTSPHLLRYHERICVDGEPIDDAALIAAFVAVERAREDVSLTYFEFGTLAALHHFRASGCRVQVLEVGLGGRLDAVNIVDADVALITSIGLDHQDWLGHGRDAIAAEKAGIARKDRPLIVSEPDPPASLLTVASDIGAKPQRLGLEFTVQTAPGGRWAWRNRETALSGLPEPGIPGPEQIRNAAGVIAALLALRDRLTIDTTTLAAALTALQVPGRLQRFGRVLVDVAHNSESVEALVGQLRALGVGQSEQARCILVLGMLSDKPVEAVCARLAPLVRTACFATLPPPRGLSGADLREAGQSQGLSGSVHASVEEALHAALSQANPDEHVVVCGSFLTVAAALEVLSRKT